MIENMIVQGRTVTTNNLQEIRQLIKERSDWGRSKISVELCKRWKWYRPAGGLKDMACRELLIKLERKGLIKLPPRKCGNTRRQIKKHVKITIDQTPIREALEALRPLSVTALLNKSNDADLFNFLVSTYHYLGFGRAVGQNMKYIVRDKSGRELACMLFGSAAWKTKPRDQYIGWLPAQRQKGLHLLTNNTRFLVLPWVQVPNLASHILSQITKRIQEDWQQKYGQPVVQLETFVDQSRFKGTCYRAANWVLVGETQGRTRNDRTHRLHVPKKDIYLYPLTRRFREELTEAGER